MIVLIFIGMVALAMAITEWRWKCEFPRQPKRVKTITPPDLYDYCSAKISQPFNCVPMHVEDGMADYVQSVDDYVKTGDTQDLAELCEHAAPLFEIYDADHSRANLPGITLPKEPGFFETMHILKQERKRKDEADSISAACPSLPLTCQQCFHTCPHVRVGWIQLAGMQADHMACQQCPNFNGGLGESVDVHNFKVT